MLIWLLRIVSLAALAAFCAAVWYAGPMLGFGDARPLAGEWIRAVIIGIAIALVVAYYGVRLILRLRAQRALEQAIATAEEAGTDASILKTRMGEAIATLKRTGQASQFSL